MSHLVPTGSRAALLLEVRKLLRSPVARIAGLSVLLLSTVTTVGGYAAATYAPRTDMGRKAAGMLMAPGWPGYTGLAATGLGVSMLLAAGIVMAWSAGREFTDNTVVGLFAVPAHPRTIGLAKLVAALAWVMAVSLVAAVTLTVGGWCVGLPVAGATTAGLVVLAVGTVLGAGAVPSMWVASRWHGYLPGIAATLAIVVVSNVAAGFGLGGVIPWTIPVLWATPGSGVAGPLVWLPVAVAAAGTWAVVDTWRNLQLGTS